MMGQPNYLGKKMRINIAIYLILVFHACTSVAQVKDTTIIFGKNPTQRVVSYCQYGDSQFMELHTNGRIYQFKSGIKDGLNVAFYDNKYQDTAMVAVVTNGEMEGVVRRWNKKGNYIESECEYTSGFKNGYCNYYLIMDGEKLTNVSRYKMGFNDGDIRIEF